MATYHVMRESFRDEGAYVPGVVWVYDGHQITVAAAYGFEERRASLEQRITDALGSGFHTDDIWTYYAEQGGQHYTSMRSKPEALVAPNLTAALDAALASLKTAR
jgi:hypothetical protein